MLIYKQTGSINLPLGREPKESKILVFRSFNKLRQLGNFFAWRQIKKSIQNT